MNSLQVLGGGGVGIFPTTIDATFYNRSGTTMARGDVVMVDMVTGPQAESASVDPGGQGTSIWSNVDTPTVDGLKYGVLCVALEEVLDDKQGRFRLSGIVDAFCIDAGSAAAIGDAGIVTTSKNFDTVMAAFARIVGVFLDAATSTGTRGLRKIWFNGLPGGLGMHYAS